jgi:hypothetical protein
MAPLSWFRSHSMERCRRSRCRSRAPADAHPEARTLDSLRDAAARLAEPQTQAQTDALAALRARLIATLAVENRSALLIPLRQPGMMDTLSRPWLATREVPLSKEEKAFLDQARRAAAE